MLDDPTPTHGSVSMYAEAALNVDNKREGINVRFDNEDYPNPEACRKALVRFRNSFSALKAKDRRLANRTFAEPRFENLGCYVEETPNGWLAVIKSNFHYPSRVTKANGEPLPELQPDYPRWKALQIRATNEQGRSCPFSQDEVNFFWDFDAEMARRVYADKGWEFPPTRH